MTDAVLNEHGGVDFQSATLTRQGLHCQVKMFTNNLSSKWVKNVCLKINLGFIRNMPLDLHRWLNLTEVFYAAVSTSLLVYWST